MGGTISAVGADSLAGRVGLQPEDELIFINGRSLRDVIDVRFYSAEERLTLRVRRKEKEFTVGAERRYDEPLGLEFAHPTFDGIRRCNNRCEFCFVAQMPPGLRRSLYVRDDDYRYSFLFGNYITLTNLDEADWARIGKQHLSPLYVSVHATAPDLRRWVLHNPAAPDVMAQLRRLVSLGVEVHTQIVVVPGLNDGPRLDRSIGDLAGLYPAVRSVSVVPVGLTRFHRGGCRVHTDAEMRVVFEQVTGWQARLRERLGVNFAYLSDEWYLRLDEKVPSVDSYDGLNLTENGVGRVRQFLEAAKRETESRNTKHETRNARHESRITKHGTRITNHESRILVTGTLFAPVLRSVIADLPVEVVSVVNCFFGQTVTVAGLLTGRDVVVQLRERDLRDVVALPPAMFGGPEGQSLDEMWPVDIEEALGRKVVTVDDLE